MHKFILFFSLVLFSNYLLAQNDEGIVKFEDLEYNSYLEEIGFHLLQNDSADLFLMLTAVDPSADSKNLELYRRKVRNTATKFRDNKFLKLKPKRKALKINVFLNDYVLNNYSEKAFFSNLLSHGKYNDLTSSAYYGFLLEELNIDYSFQKLNHHICPMVLPDDEKIIIETNKILSETQNFGENLQTDFFNFLVQNEIISAEEYYSNSREYLFDRFFLPESDIGMKELVGLQYRNDALNKLMTGNYRLSISQIKKAYFICPTQQMFVMFLYIMDKSIPKIQMRGLEDGKYIILLSRFPENTIDLSVVENMYLLLSDNVLFKSSNQQLYDEIYNYLISRIENPDLKPRINYLYNYLKGRSLIAQLRFKEGLELIENAYVLNPKDLELQTIFITTLNFLCENSRGSEMVQKLEYYNNKYIDIGKNGMFRCLLMSAYLFSAEEYFDNMDADNGINSLNSFEELYISNPNVELSQELVVNAYSAAAVYFFGRYNEKEAGVFLKRGLKIIPGNHILKYRLHSL